MIIQVDQDDPNVANFSQIFPEKFSNFNLSSVEKCPKLGTLKAKIPQEIWETSELSEELQLEIGQSLSLKCPENLKISQDNDSFSGWDDIFSLSCTPLKILSETEYFPKCVEYCNECLPEAPQLTGLTPLKPLNTIPVGGFAQYICTDTSLGVDAVISLKVF